MSAVEQAGRHHVEWLKFLRHGTEDLLQVRQHGPSELIYQKCAVGIEHLMGGTQDRVPQLRRHGGIGNTRDHIISPVELKPRQYGAGIRRRAMNHVEPVILQLGAKESHEV
ncbi:MAG: hypothetical protein ACJ8BC_00325, partial [Gemmatimonadales bacterium]